MNTICFGAYVIGYALAWELTYASLVARFSGEERHLRRLDKVSAVETLDNTQPAGAKS